MSLVCTSDQLTADSAAPPPNDKPIRRFLIMLENVRSAALHDDKCGGKFNWSLSGKMPVLVHILSVDVTAKGLF